MKIDDGGPAFPLPEMLTGDGRTVQPNYWGMFLRDYFAAAALTGMSNMGAIVTVHNGDIRMVELPKDHERIITELAYRYADSMLAAREKTK